VTTFQFSLGKGDTFSFPKLGGLEGAVTRKFGEGEAVPQPIGITEFISGNVYFKSNFPAEICQYLH
jgi:hypothetical protein